MLAWFLSIAEQKRAFLFPMIFEVIFFKIPPQTMQYCVAIFMRTNRRNAWAIKTATEAIEPAMAAFFWHIDCPRDKHCQAVFISRSFKHSPRPNTVHFGWQWDWGTQRRTYTSLSACLVYPHVKSGFKITNYQELFLQSSNVFFFSVSHNRARSHAKSFCVEFNAVQTQAFSMITAIYRASQSFCGASLVARVDVCASILHSSAVYAV